MIDFGLHSIRVIVNVHRLQRQPKAGLQISRLMIQGTDYNFYPFAVKYVLKSSCAHHLSQKWPCFFLTEISQDFTVLTPIKKISPDDTERPICCHQFSQDSLIVTCVPDPFNNGDGSAVFVTVDEDTKVDFSFSNIDYCFGFPFGIGESMDTYYIRVRLWKTLYLST